MLQAISERWHKYQASKIRRKFLDNPVGNSVSTYLLNSLYTDETYLGRFLSDTNKEFYINKILSDVCLMTLSDDVVMECRRYICKYAGILTHYGLPTIYPPPKKDYSGGYRGMPGITGKIYKHLNELASKDTILKEYFWNHEAPDKDKSEPGFIYEALLMRSSEAQLQLYAANILRIALGDHKNESDKDWLQKYIEIEYALSESHYRELLGLKDILERQSPLGSSASIFYPVFHKLIINGKQHPRFEWEEMTNKRTRQP